MTNEYTEGKMKYDKISAKVFLIRESDGKIAIQVRSDNKKEFPNCYDFSAGGGVDDGETPLQGAIREMYEEIKVETEIKQIGKVDFYHANKTYAVNVFIGKIDKDIEWFEPLEVKAIKYFTLDGLLAEYELQKSNGTLDTTFDGMLVSALESKGVIDILRDSL